jgi:predicted TIM-barrel enzyme
MTQLWRNRASGTSDLKWYNARGQVSSSLKKDGVMENPVDPARVKKFVAAVKSAR